MKKFDLVNVIFTNRRIARFVIAAYFNKHFKDPILNVDYRALGHGLIIFEVGKLELQILIQI
jgi:hypothetical protein